MKKVILCTKNKGKVVEFEELIKGFKLEIELVSLFDLNDNDEVIEDGASFKENSFIKAKYYFDKYHLPTISDDSGLCIDALDGRPGINSARYSGLGPKGNIAKVLKELEGITNRNAHFMCDLCYIDESGNNYHFEGRVDGVIGYSEDGNGGFGYDPIFNVLIDGKYQSMASIGESEKNKLSHRYHAIKKFASWMIAK